MAEWKIPTFTKPVSNFLENSTAVIAMEEILEIDDTAEVAVEVEVEVSVGPAVAEAEVIALV